jgi:hypothetical protein
VSTSNRVRRMAAIGGGVLASLLIASSALATNCTNASRNQRNPAAGAQLLLDMEGNVLWISDGLQARLDHGVVDFETAEGFHGILAFDIDGDGTADVSTWFGVGPDGDELPVEAQFRGPACKGVTNIGIYFEQCLGG